MSLTRTVPAAVPSLFHNSRPFTESSVEKARVPLTLVRLEGIELPDPGRMSLTRTVPAAVPSLFHNSKPLAESRATKYSVPLTPVRLAKVNGNESLGPGTMSLTRTVPAAVPSLFHNSTPLAG